MSFPACDARRSEAALEDLWEIAARKKLSSADAPGLIYVFRDEELWKAGRTNNIKRRIREWERDCPAFDREWIGWRWTPYANRTEYLVHLALERICVGRPRFQCNCGRVHVEKFDFGGASTSGELILSVIEMVIDFVLSKY
ncbi:hypothetical protein D9757_013062 [Collybiopsis confluens]|uniref:Bacteriophage T5 Orf172 DNA-binding domain-containing protein n=1 Tax=Collybiopsis confluens TaxID=2823264 RepID=A0A8H5G369_9AGAR|nr:hypothetical protein D9757_013062 [Collybiopsis confluens]